MAVVGERLPLDLVVARLELRWVDPHAGRVRGIDRALGDGRSGTVQEGHLAAVGELLGEEGPDDAGRALHGLAVTGGRSLELGMGRNRGRHREEQRDGNEQRRPRRAAGDVTVHAASVGTRRRVRRPGRATISATDPGLAHPAGPPLAHVGAPVPTSVPTVPFTDERLSNGLRLIVAEDHLAPVVAVNVWYDVGSKHEQPGKTGFAHLFEHVMFQGSAHVGKAEHIALIQAAGGTMNGTTWLDRTNYFETLPAHQLELALWLEADRMGTLLDALSQENLDNQREVVKNEKRWSYDNRPYGSWQEKLQGHLYPEEHPYHHNTIGSMEDLDAASLEDVQSFFRTWYAPNNAVLSVVGDVDTAQVREAAERFFGGIPPNPDFPTLPDLSLPPTLGGERRETVLDRVPLPRIYFGFRAPAFGDTRLDALDVASQILAGGKGAGSIAGSCATSASPRTSRCSRWASSVGHRSARAGPRSAPGSRSTVSRRRSSRSSSG